MESKTQEAADRWLKTLSQKEIDKMLLENDDIITPYGDDREGIIRLLYRLYGHPQANTVEWVEEKHECEKWCGMNYCDDNGCLERKKDLVGDPVAPTEQTVKGEDVEAAAITYDFALKAFPEYDQYLQRIGYEVGFEEALQQSEARIKELEEEIENCRAEIIEQITAKRDMWKYDGKHIERARRGCYVDATMIVQDAFLKALSKLK